MCGVYKPYLCYRAKEEYRSLREEVINKGSTAEDVGLLDKAKEVKHIVESELLTPLQAARQSYIKKKRKRGDREDEVRILNRLFIIDDLLSYVSIVSLDYGQAC